MSIEEAKSMQSIMNVRKMRPFLYNNQAYVLNSNNTMQKLRTNDEALLRHDEWKDIDEQVTQVATDRLVGIRDLQERNLTHNLGGIGKTISQWEDISNMTKASIDMDGDTLSEQDTQAFKTNQVPVPIVHKDFVLGARRLEASRTTGESLDVTQANAASRIVTEASEDMLFSGDTVNVNGNPIYGYTTFPDRSEVTMSTAWDAIGSDSNEDIFDDVKNMIQKAIDAKHYGPYHLYIPRAYQTKLEENFNSFDTRTVRNRLLEISGLEAIRVADRLEGDNVVLVEMDRNTVDLAIAQDITTVQWQKMNPLKIEFKVFAVWVPRLKSDFDGNSGIVHLSTS